MQKSRYPDSFSAHSIYIFFRKTRFFRGVVREFQRAIEQMMQVDFFTDDLLRGRRLAGLEEITPADFDRRDPHDLGDAVQDRKSTRLNSSHQIISYAVFCLKKKKQKCSRQEINTK